jgi:DNA-binding MarR family transcriptional regulator
MGAPKDSREARPVSKAPAVTAPYADPKGEFPFDVATYLFHLFVVVARYRDPSLDRALKPLGLNVSRHRAIAVISRMQPCPMSELADFSAVDRTTMTRTVDQLVADGLVARGATAKDRRQVLLTLTEDGRKVHRRALKLIFEHNQQSLAGMSEPHRRQAVRALEAILANLVADPLLSHRLMFRPERETPLPEETSAKG